MDYISQSTPTTVSPKLIVPPPIFVHGVNSFKGMIERINKTILSDSFLMKALANNAVKINIRDVDNYSKLVHEFLARNIKFFTYQIKTDRAFKVVLRNLHHSTQPAEIEKALQTEGFIVRNVSNIWRHHQTKNLLPLFFVDLEPIDGCKKIYELKSLLHLRITVESQFLPLSTDMFTIALACFVPLLCRI